MFSLEATATRNVLDGRLGLYRVCKTGETLWVKSRIVMWYKPKGSGNIPSNCQVTINCLYTGCWLKDKLIIVLNRQQEPWRFYSASLMETMLFVCLFFSDRRNHIKFETCFIAESKCTCFITSSYFCPSSFLHSAMTSSPSVLSLLFGPWCSSCLFP